MDWFYKILWLLAITTFFATAYFLNWISGVNEIISGINQDFWAKLPFEFQILITGFIIVVILGLIRMLTRD